MAERDAVRDAEDMPVYRLLYALALDVEKATRSMGPDFRWLRVQSLRSSESAFTNMREGFYSQYSTEYLQGLYRSRREAQETIGHVVYGKDVGQLPAEVSTGICGRYRTALKQLAGLIISIEKKIASRGKGKPGAPKVRETRTEYGIDLPPWMSINH